MWVEIDSTASTLYGKTAAAREFSLIVDEREKRNRRRPALTNLEAVRLRQFIESSSKLHADVVHARDRIACSELPQAGERRGHLDARREIRAREEHALRRAAQRLAADARRERVAVGDRLAIAAE